MIDILGLRQSEGGVLIDCKNSIWDAKVFFTPTPPLVTSSSHIYLAYSITQPLIHLMSSNRASEEDGRSVGEQYVRSVGEQYVRSVGEQYVRSVGEQYVRSVGEQCCSDTEALSH